MFANSWMLMLGWSLLLYYEANLLQGISATKKCRCWRWFEFYW